MPTTELTLDGPAGALEARLDRPDGPTAGCAVLCHPHPQMGGRMDDAVLATALKPLLAAELTCLRFNFRGVGASDGIFDQGEGEAEDVAAALAAACVEVPEGNRWLVGYSFGAAMAWQAVQNGARPDVLALIAPPVGLMDFAGTLPTSTELAAIAGDRDEFCDLADIRGWVEQHADGSALQMLSGADHFFSGNHQALANAIAAVTKQA